MSGATSANAAANGSKNCSAGSIAVRGKLKIQNALEQAGIHFTDGEAGETGVCLQIGKR
jgi:hypothetical protein